MKAQLFEIELLETIPPDLDPVARLAAKEAALGEFARVQELRLVVGGRDPESLYNLRELARQLPHPERSRTEFRRSPLATWLAGVASAGIVSLGVGGFMGSQGLHGETFAFAMSATIYDEPAETYATRLEVPLPAAYATAELESQPVPTESTGPDQFRKFATNAFNLVTEEPVSTFSIDVDTASYSYIRRQLNAGVLPQKDAVRAEEMVNYFDYAWPAPQSPDQPFKATIAVGDSPWGEGRKLVHIGIKGYELPAHEEPDVNLVLLIDVSGSMAQPDRLPLVQQSVELLLRRLKLSDTVAIVAYAGEASVVLRPTEVRQWQKILDALQGLQADGATAGAAGIQLAYDLAQSSFRPEGVNRILLATDGDFNVGLTDPEELKSFVARGRERGFFLSVLGVGAGNYDDETAQALAQNGNGVAAYVDTLREAEKVLVQEARASLFTIATDVKLQVEFNPRTVAQYRLVGYETRALEREDFDDDAVDAGDIGSGHAVTAIYEITPTDSDGPTRGSIDDYGWLKIRYKRPEARKSELIVQRIPVDAPALPAPLQRDVEFATAVAGFAQLLRGGTDTGSLTDEDVIRQAQSASGDDLHGYRAEFVDLVRKAQVASGD